MVLVICVVVRLRYSAGIEIKDARSFSPRCSIAMSLDGLPPTRANTVRISSSDTVACADHCLSYGPSSISKAASRSTTIAHLRLPNDAGGGRRRSNHSEPLDRLVRTRRLPCDPSMELQW